MMTSLPDATTDEAVWIKRCWLLLLGVLACRLVYLFFAIDFDLAGDESYYWDWGRRLDWCYYSKPPLIGWLMRLVGWLSGDQAWAVRVAALLFGTGTVALLAALTRRLYGARAGFFAALMMMLTPANLALNIGFTIDAPLLLCWSAGLLSFWRALENPKHWAWWGALALAIGFGCLAKQMMLVFPLMMLIHLATSPEDRAVLRLPQLWLSIALGMAFLLPVLHWQQTHGWVTGQHMQENFASDELSFGEWLERFLRYPVLQAVTYAGITWGVVIAALWVVLLSWRTATRRERFLAVFSAPALALFLVLALRMYINENWPAAYYISAFALGAGVALSRPGWERWMKRGLWLGGALLVFAYAAVPVLLQSQALGQPRFARLTELLGWREAGQQAGALYAKVPRPGETFVLVLDKRQNASSMAFYMPQHPRVYRWPKEGRIESQYEVWPNAADKVGQDAFIIYPDVEKDGKLVKPSMTVFIKRSFESIEKIGDITAPIGKVGQRSFQVFLGKKMKRFPASIPEQVEEMKRNGEQLALPEKYR